jgi:hypothetical protein
MTLGAVIAAAVVGFLVSWFVGLAVLVVGAGAAYLLYAKHAKRQTSRVSYDLGGDRIMTAHFARVGKACGILDTSEGVWNREKTSDSAKNERALVRVGRLEKPGIETNVEVWGIDSGETTAYFFPEVAESGKVFSDTEVLGETYLYTLSDGSPDRRFGSNPRLPEVLYGDLDLSADGWKGVSIRASKESAAAQFVLAFAEEQDTERYEQWRGIRPEGDRGKLDPTHDILGLPAGASKTEITAAYRRMARTYHPDKTASFDHEFRDLADQRMKDVNAAYAKLRRTAQ